MRPAGRIGGRLGRYQLNEMETDMRKAEKIGTYKGRAVYRVPVEITFDRLGRTLESSVESVTVISTSAIAAANAVTDEVKASLTAETVRPFTVTAYGPKGGEVLRYKTWHGAIGEAMWNNARMAGYQGDLFHGYNPCE